MTAITNTPTNVNYLSPLGFRFQIKKAPNVTFYVQSVAMPSLTLGSYDIPTPFTRIPFAGDHLVYGDLSVQFKVDESMLSYLEIYNWMLGMGKPQSYQQYKDLNNAQAGDGVYSDLTLTILSSNMNPTHTVTFTDAFPIQLTDLTFDSTLMDVDYLQATATFKFTKFDITTI